MACVWVHFSLVQFTVLPTSLPKETDRGCVGQVWPSFKLDTKSKVQGVINNPHFKERKMNTEFWSSNTTTCNDLISPAPILLLLFFFFFSLPQLARGGECRQVSITRTHLIGLYSTWLLVTTQYLTGLRLYELHKHDWFFIYLWWRFPIYTGKRFLSLLLSTFFMLFHWSPLRWSLPPRSLYGFTARAFHVPCLSSMRMAWGSSPQGRND